MDFRKILTNKFFYLCLFFLFILIGIYFFLLIYEKKNQNHSKLFFVDLVPPEWHYLYRNNSKYHRKQLPCPNDKDIILIIGQSNAGNYVLSDDYDTSNLINFYREKCYEITEPILGSTGHLKSITSAIASKILNKKNYIFINNSWAATTILDWASNKESKLTNFTIKELQYIVSLGNNLKYVIWIQGESDSVNFSNLDIDQGPLFFSIHGYENYYYEAFNILRKKITSSFANKKVKFIITQSTICNTKKNKVINSQKLKLAENENIFLLTVTDNLDNSYRYDGCHLNEKGVEKTSNEIIKLINNLDSNI